RHPAGGAAALSRRSRIARGTKAPHKKKGRRQADGPSIGRKRPRRAAENRAEARYRAAPICSRTAQNASAAELCSAWLFITPRRAVLAAWMTFPAAPIVQEHGRHEDRLQRN